MKATGLVFDSGTSYTYIASADLEVLKTFINKSCSISNYIMTCTCSSESAIDTEYPVIELTHGSSSSLQKISLKGSAYMQYTSGTTCTSYFRSNTSFKDLTYWLLGLNIYRQFEIIHDLEGSRVGLKKIGTSTVEKIDTESD